MKNGLMQHQLGNNSDPLYQSVYNKPHLIVALKSIGAFKVQKCMVILTVLQLLLQTLTYLQLCVHVNIYMHVRPSGRKKH